MECYDLAIRRAILPLMSCRENLSHLAGGWMEESGGQTQP